MQDLTLISTIGEKLHDLRKDKGKTQAEVAKAIGISEATLSKYENDDLEGMSVNKLQRLAAFFGVTLNHLLGIPDTEYENDVAVFKKYGLVNEFLIAVNINTDKTAYGLARILNRLLTECGDHYTTLFDCMSAYFADMDYSAKQFYAHEIIGALDKCREEFIKSE